MTIFVLGVHRSGTSCVAGILHHLGLFMGDRLMPPSPRNPKGFFEDRDFVALLVQCDEQGDTPENRERVRAFVEAQDARRPLWGTKAPGLLQYIDWVAPMVADYKVIDVRRDPAEVARSNVAIHAEHCRLSDQPVTLEVLAGLLHRLSHMERKRDAFRGDTSCPWLQVNYEDVTARPTAMVALLADFAGLRPTAAQRAAARAFAARP